MKQGKSTRRFAFFSLLVIWGAVTVLTGSPFPTWDLESLNSPIAVKSVKADGLILEDGSTLKLPLVKRIPADDPLILAAVEHGIEIGKDGKVFGLLMVNRTCGLDTCVWHRRRVNLTSLVTLVLPENLDESQVPPEVITEISEIGDLVTAGSRPSRYDNGRINGYDLWPMRRIEEALDYALMQMKKQRNLGPTAG